MSRTGRRLSALLTESRVFLTRSIQSPASHFTEEHRVGPYLPRITQRTHSLALVCLLCVAPCLASQPLAPLLACRALTDGAARLACFDRESATLATVSPPVSQATSVPTAPATLSTSTAPQAPSPTPMASVTASTAPQPAPARPTDSKENFGLPDAAVAQKEVAAGTRAADLPKIDAHLTALSVSASGQATFILDNGQVWRQLLSEGDLFAKPGDLVTISRGFLNSYWLKVQSGRGCKVTRIL
jgi:hypothetical protein